LSAKRIILEGEARIGRVTMPLFTFSLSPEDLSSPLSFQMALNKILEDLTNILEKEPKARYMAEVKFTDAMNVPVTFAVDLGDKLPPFGKDRVKARIIVELYEEDDENNVDVPP
jgi:hypothetical protein